MFVKERILSKFQKNSELVIDGRLRDPIQIVILGSWAWAYETARLQRRMGKSGEACDPEHWYRTDQAEIARSNAGIKPEVDQEAKDGFERGLTDEELADRYQHEIKGSR